MSYQVVIERPAQKYILKQPREQQERILRAIYKLPGEGDIKPLSGLDEMYRLRVGDYRVIYTIERDVLIVRVVRVGNRGDIYKK